MLQDIGAVLKVDKLIDIIPTLLSLQREVEKYKDIDPVSMNHVSVLHLYHSSLSIFMQYHQQLIPHLTLIFSVPLCGQMLRKK